jgi:type IV secretory pathway component VirB8
VVVREREAQQELLVVLVVAVVLEVLVVLELQDKVLMVVQVDHQTVAVAVVAQDKLDKQVIYPVEILEVMAVLELQ